jgi:hypothetical protein
MFYLKSRESMEFENPFSYLDSEEGYYTQDLPTEEDLQAYLNGDLFTKEEFDYYMSYLKQVELECQQIADQANPALQRFEVIAFESTSKGRKKKRRNPTGVVLLRDLWTGKVTEVSSDRLMERFDSTAEEVFDRTGVLPSDALRAFYFHLGLTY